MGRLTGAAYGRVDALRAAVLTALAQRWEQQPGWSDTDAEQFASRAVPLLEAAQVGAYGLLAAAFLTEARATLDRDVPDLPVPPSQAATTLTLRGVDTATVLRRPFVTVRTALSQGTPPAAALTRGATRLRSLADTGMQLATTHAADAALTTAYAGTGFRWYARIPTGRESCALCLIASTQRYRIGDLMAIHSHCDCRVGGPYDTPDPGHVINPDLLEQVHQLVGEQIGPRYVNRSAQGYQDLIVTSQHGEIGPVITIRGQKHTGPGDVPSGRGRPTTQPAPADGSGAGGRGGPPPRPPRQSGDEPDEYRPNAMGERPPWRPSARPRPTPTDLLHVLDGDPNRPWSGGHRFGSARGKSEFPADWDDERIADAIDATVERPQVITREDQTWGFYRLVDDIIVAAFVRSEGREARLITSFPVLTFPA